MFALNQHVLATLVKNWQCLVEQRGMFGRPSDSISRGLETRPAINLLQTISLHCSFIMGIGQQLQRLNLFSKWNPNCSESMAFSPHDANSILCNWHLTYSLVIDRPILALMVVNHRKPKSSEEKVQTHPPASSFCNIVSWILNLFFPSSENSQNVLPFFFYAFGEIISFLASTFFARPRPHPTEFYGKFECETICRRRNLWRGSTLSTGQRCKHSINSELILLLLWVRHFFCTIVPGLGYLHVGVSLFVSPLWKWGWVGCVLIKMLKCFFFTKRVGDGHSGLSKMFGKARTFYKKMKEPIYFP